MPVVTIEPAKVNTIPYELGQADTIDFEITNHGLIRADHLRFVLPTSHPYLIFESVCCFNIYHFYKRLCIRCQKFVKYSIGHLSGHTCKHQSSDFFIKYLGTKKMVCKTVLHHTLSILCILKASRPIIIKFYVQLYWTGRVLQNVSRQIGWQQKITIDL